MKWMTSTPALVVALWAVWSLTFVAVKLGTGEATPDVFVFLRVASATAALGLLLVVLRRRADRAPVHPRLHRYALVLGATNVAAFLILQTYGIARAGIGLSAVLIYTQPLVVAVLARAGLGERITRRQIAGLACGWLGVVAVVGGELARGDAGTLGIVLLLVSAFAWAIGTVVFKGLPTTVDVWRVLFWQNVYGLVPVVAVLLAGGFTATWGPSLLVSGVFAGVLGSAGGFGVQFALLRRGDASVVSSWIFAVPLLSALLGVVIFGERLHLGLLAGGIGVAVGIYLVNSADGGDRGHKVSPEPAAAVDAT